MKLFDWLKPRPRYLHPLWEQRRDLADSLDGCSIGRRQDVVSKLAETNPELYESWILEPYPGPGDR